MDSPQKASQDGEGLVVLEIRSPARNARVEREAQPLLADPQRFPGAVCERHHRWDVPLGQLCGEVVLLL